MFCNALAASKKNSLTCPLVLEPATRSDPTAASPAATTGAGGLHVAGSPSARGAHQDVQIDRSGSCQNTCRRSFHGLTAAIAEPPAAVRLPAIENGADHSPVAVFQKLEVGTRLLLSIQNRSSWSL